MGISGTRRTVGLGLALLACLVLPATLVLAACGESSGSAGSSSSSPTFSPAPSGTPTPSAASMTLKVMDFNIEWGGENVSFAKVIEAVKKAQPDILCLQEAWANTKRIAKEAGYPYWNEAYVVSRYPLLEPPGAHGDYLLVEVQPGRCVAVSDTHLPSDKPGSHRMRLGKPVEAILAAEKEVRLPYIQRQLKDLPPLAEQGIPVFLLGDFNAPSWRDYTAEVVGTRDYVKYVVEWPVSKAIEQAGFVDSWRAVHPDPLKSLGLTWPADRPEIEDWTPGPYTPQDRIDFIYSMGPAKATAAQLAGEKFGPEVTIPVTPWPSDHRAVVSTFTVTPGPLPVMVALSPQVATVGDRVKAQYWADGEAGSLAVAPAGGSVADALESSALPAGGEASGTVKLATKVLDPGAYEVLLVGAGEEVRARAPLWVQAPGAKPVLTTDAEEYTSGQPIVVTWKDAPAGRTDWIAVCKADAPDPNDFLIYQYTGGISGSAYGAGGATPDGTLTLDADTVIGPWPLPPGKYVLYYLPNDGYEATAKTTFAVTE